VSAPAAADIKITVPHHFVPRHYQVPTWRAWETGCKRFVNVWHRRSGKDKTWFNLMITAALSERVGQYFYVFPTYEQARKALWLQVDKRGFRMLEHAPRPALAKDPLDQSMRLEFVNGSIVQIVGCDRPEGLRGANPVGLVLSEAAYIDQDVIDTLSPIVAENDGWLALNSTPNGRNWFHELYQNVRHRPNWHTDLYTVDDTTNEEGRPVVLPEVIQDDRDRGMDDDKIRQEYWCDFNARSRGTFYGQVMSEAREAGRVGRVPVDPHAPVQTCWDLGRSDSTAICFFQRVGLEWHWVDYYENYAQGIDHYLRVLQAKPYAWGTDFVPHDAQQQVLTAKDSFVGTMRTFGRNVVVVPKTQNIVLDIEATRAVLAQSWFDAERCKLLVQALESYHAEYNERMRTYNSYPAHDQWSHGADAVRTGAMGYRPPRPATKQPRPYRPRYLR
jgi:phage terminase large subunit